MTRLKLLEKGAALLLGITVFGAFPLFAKTMEIKIHSDLPIIEKENTNGADERIAIFNSRSDYQSKSKVWVAVQKKPIPRKEFILVEPPEAEWRHGNVWTVEDVLNEKGEIDRFAKRIVLKEQSDWGKEDNFSATVTYYQVREHPLPPNPEGTPSDNGPYFAGSDTKSLVVVAPEVSLESITFNHVPGNSDADGIDLRKNYSGPDITGPEWTPSGTQPVAYRAGVRPIVKVNFNVRPARLNRVRVKATESGEIGLTWGIAESWGLSRGGFFPGVTAVSPGLNKGNVTWEWSVSGFNGVAVIGWDGIQKTTIPVYKILGKPQFPWKEGEGAQKPWTEALDFVMDECLTKGKSSKKEALMAMTGTLHKKPYKEVSSCYKTDGTFAFSRYMQTNMYVNCYDSAAGLTVVSALTGIEIFPKEQSWVEGPLPGTYWDKHCYTIFNDLVYDCCSAMVLINGMNFNLYQKGIRPRNDSTIKDLPIIKIQ